MSQAVANVKQFAESIKTKPISGVVGGMPKDFRQSAVNLRKEKKVYKQKVKDAKSGKYDKVTGSGTPNEIIDGEVMDYPPIKDNRLPGPEQEIIDAEVIEPERKAIKDSPRMITSERVHAPKAIEPSRQWSNG
jgi:hypothetical protein